MKVKIGDKVWGCAYVMNGDTGDMKLICKPEYGIIVKSGSSYSRMAFSKLRKDGMPYNSSVYLYSREYASTEEECIKLYNHLIDSNIEKLESKISIMKGDKIDENQNK